MSTVITVAIAGLDASAPIGHNGYGAIVLDADTRLLEVIRKVENGQTVPKAYYPYALRARNLGLIEIKHRLDNVELGREHLTRVLAELTAEGRAFLEQHVSGEPQPPGAPVEVETK